MHTIELLEQALITAQQLGYGVRQEWMGGCGGGACEIAGQKWIFVDLSLTASEQFDQISASLLSDPAIRSIAVPAELSRVLGLPAAA